MKYIDVKEFKEVYLQEANRLFFHPLGLALSVEVNSDGEVIGFGPVLDSREDPEGYCFTTIDQNKVKEIQKRFEQFKDKRTELFGDIIQTQDYPE